MKDFVKFVYENFGLSMENELDRVRSVTDCLVCSKRGEIRDIINAGDLK